MNRMRLWDDELEALRDGARAASEATAAVFAQHLTAPPEDVRERVAFVRSQFADTWDAVTTTGAAAVDEVVVPAPTGDVTVRIHRPEGPPRAAFVRIHGSGWIAGSAAMDDTDNARLTAAHDIIVLSPEYRLAPEHPYPAAPDDCEAVAAWVVAHGERALGTSRFFLGGESSGAHLAAVTVLRVRDHLGAAEHVLGCVLTSGIYDLRATPSQLGNNGRPDVLDPDSVAFIRTCFLGGLDEARQSDPDVSPLFADLRGLPPALVSVGLDDHLVDDSLFLAARWAAAGNPCELAVYPNVSHALPVMPGPMHDAFLRRVDRFVGERLTG